MFIIPLMKKINVLTGGIGCGKSYIANKMKAHGIEVYDCDAAAKRIMREDESVRQKLIDLIGLETYDGNKLNKAIVSKFLLASSANAKAINAIVHPAVAQDFLESPYTWLESAIYFESGFDKVLEQITDAKPHVVCVSAPLEVRVERIVKRDNITPAQALEWINAQLPQEEKERLSDEVIQN